MKFFIKIFLYPWRKFFLSIFIMEIFIFIYFPWKKSFIHLLCSFCTHFEKFLYHNFPSSSIFIREIFILISLWKNSYFYFYFAVFVLIFLGVNFHIHFLWINFLLPFILGMILFPFPSENIFKSILLDKDTCMNLYKWEEEGKLCVVLYC